MLFVLISFVLLCAGYLFATVDAMLSLMSTHPVSITTFFGRLIITAVSGMGIIMIKESYDIKAYFEKHSKGIR
jgi:hypothetical protein